MGFLYLDQLRYVVQTNKNKEKKIKIMEGEVFIMNME